MVNLPHSPATISTANLVRARQTDKPVEDIITARVVGFNPKAKEVVAQDGGGNNYSVSPNSRFFSATVGQSVILSRSRSQSGERTIRLISIVPLGKQPSDILGQLPNQGNINELCKPTSVGSSGGGGGGAPSPPNSPDSQNSPTRTPDPEEHEEDPPSEPPTGCQPTDNAQWFNGSECPAGTDNLGFMDMPDGSTMSLCESPSGNTPSGDGCPETPDQYGWACSSTGCVFVANGSFVTQEECESACEEENRPEDPDNVETGPEDPPLPDEPVDPEEPDPSVTSTVSFTYTTNAYNSNCFLLEGQNSGIDRGGTFSGEITSVTAVRGGDPGFCGGLRLVSAIDNFGRVLDSRSYAPGREFATITDLVITYS